MKTKFVDLVRVATIVCERCKVDPAERVVVYSDTGQDSRIVEAFYAAVVAKGADATLVVTPLRRSQTPPPASATDAMMNADMVFDLASRSWLYTEVCGQVMAERTRMLQVMISPDSIVKRPLDEDVIRRTQIAAELLERSQKVRIVSEEGMDLTIERGTRPVHPQAGYVDKPGMWDSLGMGMVNFCPPEDGAEGTVAFNAMMHLSSDHNYVVEKPIRAQVKGGRLKDIIVEGKDSQLLSSWLSAFDDPGMYNIAHVGFGLDKRVSIQDYDVGWESYYGGIIIAFGSNISLTLGGKNPAKSHMDTISINCDLYLDDRQIMRRGVFMEDTGL